MPIVMARYHCEGVARPLLVVAPPAVLLRLLQVVVLLLAAAPGADAHLAAVCTATHAQRPHTVTFLFATYHKAPYEGALVPGEAHIRTPEGQVFDFSFTSFCEVPHDGSRNEYPVPAWPLDSNVSFYRDRLRQHCVCSLVLGCGGFNPATGRCTSAEGDCPLVDPLLQEIECYGEDRNVPPSKGAWARQLADDEDGNCAYGSNAGVDFPSWARTWYTAQLTGIYSGIFEVWSTGTDHNLDPSSLCVGVLACGLPCWLLGGQAIEFLLCFSICLPARGKKRELRSPNLCDGTCFEASLHWSIV
jgi:hypothetical protein